MYCPLLAAIGLSFHCFAIGQAYIIDDTNSTIQYHPVQAVVHYANDSSLDNTKVFNGTFTDTTCTTSDNCHINISFTGSGVTVYNVVFDEFNASFAVDGGSSQTYLQNSSCNTHYCYNISTYNIQSLTYATHTLDISLSSYNNRSSYFFFDYAVVNETKPSAVTSSPATASSTGSSVPQHTPSQSLTKSDAKRIGGILGGLIAFDVIVLAMLCIRKWFKRSHPKIITNIPSEAKCNSTPTFVTGHPLLPINTNRSSVPSKPYPLVYTPT